MDFREEINKYINIGEKQNTEFIQYNPMNNAKNDTVVYSYTHGNVYLHSRTNGKHPSLLQY
jgi:hypothetical protein